MRPLGSERIVCGPTRVMPKEQHLEWHLLLRRLMKKTSKNKQKTLRELKDIGQILKSVVEEIRVQVHLGVMELKQDAGPYLAEVTAASKAAKRDLMNRTRELKKHLKALRAAHRAD